MIERSQAMNVLLAEVLLLCLGFIAAVLCIDLVFDVPCWVHRRDRNGIPAEILAAAVTYYRRITRRPHLLVAAIIMATASFALETLLNVVPRLLGYPALLLFGSASLFALVKVIPTAQRLGSTKNIAEQG